ncbi:ester cyclase [Maribacter sp. HTCC2170]|uniref:ester cyclase n=1 Tax=Maribacter sp. (strain HTCC2170 / KCCM 42371) TaxID=313603 RepID=UPI00006B48BF|nr:ester cyclase [Maribacter sp. HTCC2170]EAR01683.1 hypothetical protein FB2170_14183 [Maribacter sp. HTCC2170]
MKRASALFFLITVLAFSCQSNQETQQIEKKNALILKNFKSFIENAWNKKNIDSLKTVSAPGYTRQLNGINVAGNINELEANMNIYFNGFPNLEISIMNTVAKDNQLFVQWTFEGTNTGVFGETPATGKHAVVSGYSELTFDDMGKISHEKIYYNELQLLQQLGYNLVEPVVE